VGSNETFIFKNNCERKRERLWYYYYCPANEDDTEKSTVDMEWHFVQWGVWWETVLWPSMKAWRSISMLWTWFCSFGGKENRSCCFDSRVVTWLRRRSDFMILWWHLPPSWKKLPGRSIKTWGWLKEQLQVSEPNFVWVKQVDEMEAEDKLVRF